MTDPHQTPPHSNAPGRSAFESPPWLGQRKGGDLRGWIILGGALLLVGAGVFYVVSQNKPAGAAGGFSAMGGGRRGSGGPPSIVNTAKVTPGDMDQSVTALGTVTPTATVTVKTQLAGLLMSVGFKEGQMVKKGQFLAQIDPRPFEQALAQAEAAQAKDEAQLLNARADLKRYKTLAAQDSVSGQTYDTQAALVRQLEAQVKADQAAANAQKLNLTYAHITAPVSGRVGLRQVDAGNYVTPGDTNGIVALAQVAPIDVAFSLPEDDVPEVAKAMRSGAKLGVQVFDRSGATLLAKGELLALDNLIDTTTGTVRAKARFANADGVLFPNQFVNVTLTVQTLKNVAIAPTSAIQRGQQGLFVYVVDASRQVHVRTVQTGPVQGERTAILSGVAPGETVVTDGVDRLRDGAYVVPPSACPPGGGKRSGGALCKSAQGAPVAGGQAASAAPAPSMAAPAPSMPASPGAVRQTEAGAPAPAPTPMAAPSSGGGQGGGGGAGRIQAMLAELNLDAQQQAKASEIFGEAREKAMAQAADADDGGRRAIFKAVFAEAFGKLVPYLRPDQKAKLVEMRAKAAGAQQ